MHPLSCAIVGNWVLVVEDDTDSRDALIELLNGSGFTAIGASNVGEARTAMAEDLPALVITDVVLGKDDGVELSTMAPKLFRPNAPPFVFVSGMVASRTAVPTSAAFFRKPLDVEALFEHVARYCHPEKRSRSAF